MKEIEEKIRELAKLMETVPEECKGNNIDEILNALNYASIKYCVDEMMSIIDKNYECN